MFLDVIRATIANNGYEVITCGVASAFFAQVIKFILFTVKTLNTYSLIYFLNHIFEYFRFKILFLHYITAFFK